MVNFPELVAPDLTSLFGYPSDTNRGGFQGAHIHGKTYFGLRPEINRFYEFLNSGLPLTSSDRLDLDHVSNGVLLPSAEQTTTHKAVMILGVASHSGSHVNAFNGLYFDEDAEPGDNNKFLNRLIFDIRDVAISPRFRTH